MTSWEPTYRMVGTERIDGALRTVLVHNYTWHLATVKVYADELVDCWGLGTLEDFRAKVLAGKVTGAVPDGGTISGHALGSYVVARTRWHVQGTDLIGEVIDEIARLNGRPTTSDICRDALADYLESPSAERLSALRAAYYAIPSHLRIYVLGDQDRKDGPLRTLITPIGEETHGSVVTREQHEAALRDLRRGGYDRRPTRTPSPVPSRPKALVLEQASFKDWPMTIAALRAEFPRAIQHGGIEYPTLLQAFWGALARDDAGREAVRDAPSTWKIDEVASSAGLREGWETERLSVMLGLLRQRYRDSPDLARILRETADARLKYALYQDTFWGYGDAGENWMGRLLEIVRSELASSLR